MFIAKAYAAAQSTSGELAADLAGAPSATEAFIYNMGLIVVLVALFYVLLIMPQQRRFKEHNQMLDGLKKGDRVVTGGGLVGRVDKIIDDKEVVIDLGNGLKVTALRSMIQGKTELKAKAANDTAEKKPETKSKKKSEVKKKAEPKKTSKKKAD